MSLKTMPSAPVGGEWVFEKLMHDPPEDQYEGLLPDAWVNDAEFLVLSRVLKCGVGDLYPKRPRNLGGVVRHGRR